MSLSDENHFKLDIFIIELKHLAHPELIRSIHLIVCVCFRLVKTEFSILFRTIKNSYSKPRNADFESGHT